MPFPSVSIIGCGWLGFPLATALAREGYPVKGTTTTLEKIPALKKAGIFYYVLTVDDEVRGEGAKDLFDSEIVVITLPFRRDFVDPQAYQKQIEAIALECEKSGRVRTVILTSSTSVYPDHLVNAVEDAPFTPDNDRSKVLQAIEKNILGNQKYSGIVVRLAGLYGGSRKIGAFLAGQRELSGGECPVNLVHQEDAVGILREVIVKRTNIAGQVFNACADVHPSRRELYTLAAQRMGFAPPQFIAGGNAARKIVSNEKVKKILGYRFVHPNPIKDLA